MQGRIQFFIEALDSGLPNIIDSLLVNLDNLQLGGDFTEEMMFTGFHNISTMTMSFRVQCSPGFCGPDCTTTPSDNQLVAQCHSNGSAVCLDNKRDPSMNILCSDCLYDLDNNTDCNTCLETNYDPVTNCQACLNSYDIVTDCLLCINRTYDSVTNCQACCPNYDLSTNCQACLPNYDIAVNCILCTNRRYDHQTNCTSCINGWDITTQCATCLSGFTGPNCRPGKYKVKYNTSYVFILTLYRCYVQYWYSGWYCWRSECSSVTGHTNNDSVDNIINSTH